MGRAIVLPLVLLCLFCGSIEANDGVWWQMTTSNDPIEVRYYTASTNALFSVFDAALYCDDLGSDVKLWCPSSNTEYQSVFANTAYENMASIIDGGAAVEMLDLLAAAASATTYIGIGRDPDTAPAAHMADAYTGLMDEYSCMNPQLDSDGNNIAWVWDTDQQWTSAEEGPWETDAMSEIVQPNYAIGHNCVAVGKEFSFKWMTSPCDNSIESASPGAMDMTASVPFAGARAICMTTNGTGLEGASVVDTALLATMQTRFDELKQELIAAVLMAVLMSIFTLTVGCFCCFCGFCYCCCCCKPCKSKKKDPEEDKASTTPPPAAAGPPPPAPSPYQAPQQPAYAQPQQPAYAQPQQPMGGMNFNITSNNTNTNTNR